MEGAGRRERKAACDWDTKRGASGAATETKMKGGRKTRVWRTAMVSMFDSKVMRIFLSLPI